MAAGFVPPPPEDNLDFISQQNYSSQRLCVNAIILHLFYDYQFEFLDMTSIYMNLVGTDLQV